MTVFIKPEDLPQIEKLAAADPSETIRKRVHLLLLYEAGMRTAEIAEKVDLSPGRVLYWRRQYLKDGMNVFGDAVSVLDALDDEAEAREATKKSKKSKKSGKVALETVTRKLRRAEKKGASTDSLREVLSITVAQSEKERKKLKKSIKSSSKKKAARVRSRLKEMDRKIKRAKKVLKKSGR